MQATRWQTLLSVALGSGLACYLLLRALSDGGSPPLPVPDLTFLPVLAVAIAVLFLGRSVRRFTDGKRTAVDALRAARILLLAKACSYGGALLAGYFGAHVAVAFVNIGAPALRQHASAAAITTLACVVLVIAALVAEWWCRVPPEDDDGDTSTSAA